MEWKDREANTESERNMELILLLHPMMSELWIFLSQPSAAHHESAHPHLLILYAQSGLVEFLPDGGNRRWRRCPTKHCRPLWFCRSFSYHTWGPGGPDCFCHIYPCYNSMSHEVEKPGLHTLWPGKQIADKVWLAEKNLVFVSAHINFEQKLHFCV